MDQNNEYNKKEFQKKGGRKAARSVEFENRRAEKRAACALRRARKEKEWLRSA